MLGAQVLATGLLLAACTDTPPGRVVDPDLEAMEADAIVFGVTHNVTRAGIREYDVSADTMLTFRDSTVVLFFGNVTLTAYHEDTGSEKAIVTSDRGRLEQGTNELWAEGNAVLLIRADGRRIESYELHYRPDDDEIRSDSATVMYDGDTVVEGTSFTSDLNFERVRILNGRTRGAAVRF